MVLAYFIRKEYEEDLALLLQNQQVQVGTVQQQAEMARQQAETVKDLTTAVQQLLEQNRLLLERLDRQEQRPQS